jgi:F420-dependent oxidoreductase-like protein
MRYALMTEPQQGLDHDEVLALARTAEEAGFEAFFRSDHYDSFPGEKGLPTTDAWATLAGLAREVPRIGLGALVSPVTFRLPGPFAKMVTTVDHMSGGRIELGMGIGWNDGEHRHHGIPFPPMGERFERLEEALEIVHGLWTEPDGWSFSGRHWQVEQARFAPKPVPRPGRRHPNVIVGGEGKPRSARLAARFADEYNLTSANPSRAREAFARIADACRAEGRDPDDMVRSAMTGVLIGETEADVEDRVREQLRVFGSAGTDARAWLDERRNRWIIGTPEQAAERIEEFARAGTQRLMLQDFLPRDLEMVRLAGRTLVAAG